MGLTGDRNRNLAHPEARIIPLDHQALSFIILVYFSSIIIMQSIRMTRLVAESNRG